MGSEFTTAVATANLDLLPIKNISKEEQIALVKKADLMLELKRDLLGEIK